MARNYRIYFPTAIYHIMLRGNDKQPIFFSSVDKIKMCALLQDGCERFDHRIHAYCFMSNHIHLAIQVGSIDVSQIMHNLAFRYTQYINRKFDRVGHLFQGRFKSILICGKKYFKELIRYIHLNPVRAGIVTHPEEYLWSSHRAYLGLENLTWITLDQVLNDFETNRITAQLKFKKFVLDGIGIEKQYDFQFGSKKGILGDDNFIEESIRKNQKKAKRYFKIEDLVEVVCSKFNFTIDELSSGKNDSQYIHARELLSFLIRETPNLSFTDLAKYLKRDPSTLSRLASNFIKKNEHSEKLAHEFFNILMEK